MRAIANHTYGPPLDVLDLVEVGTPEIGEGDVLVRVHGASVNPGDLALVTGQPSFMRVQTGLRRPRNPVPGMDFAGVVEAVGADVGGVSVGQQVYGEAGSTFAEFARMRPDQLSPKPAGLTFPQAAAIPLAATTAWQALHKAQVCEGTRLLVNGASGGVGHFAVQIAKEAGAHVTAVCSGRNADVVARLGADELIDYATTDYTTGGRAYDVIFDAVRTHPWSDVRRVLAPDGTYLAVGTSPRRRPGESGFLGPLPEIAGTAVRGVIVRGQKIVTVAARANRGIEHVTELAESGRLAPLIERTYSLEEVPQALARLASRHVVGKIAIDV
jgi:NADPH:quinone reductase-like Zn-dependent oxidoreductase